VTLRCVVHMVFFTYAAGLGGATVVCTAFVVWPGGLLGSDMAAFVVGCLLHAFLTIGYSYSVYTHLKLHQLRMACDAVLMADITAPTVASIQPGPAPSAPPPEVTSANEMECIVCMEDTRTTVMQPCGHLCLCSSCAGQIMRGTRPTCPVCRVVVDDTIRVFT